MFIIALLKFLFFLLFFLYLPVKLSFRFLKIKIENKLIETGLAILSGIVAITLFSIILKYFGISLSVLWIMVIISAIFLVLNIKNITINKPNVFILSFILLGVVAQNIVLFRGGWETSTGLVFPSIHDTMWNISLTTHLGNQFPPQNPAIAGIPLKNNHYFYPLFLSITRYLTGINIFDLYFRFGPILVSLLFGLGLYAVSSIFTKNIIFRGIAIFLGYFSGNFAYLLPFIFGRNFDWKGNTFFADQPFDQLINPYSVLGFTLVFFGIYCFSQISLSKKNSSLGYSIIGGLFFGSLYGFKSFGGIIVILSLGIIAFISLIFSRKLSLIPITLISFTIFILVFFFTTDIGTASIIWAPGWLLTQIMTDRDKLNLPQFADLEAYYKSIENYLGLMKIKLTELFIYLVGNLGTRIVGLIYLICILFITHVRSHKYIMQFIAIIVFISLTIPLLFNLRNSTFNIIQFTPYALVLLAVMSALFLEKVYFLLHGKRKFVFRIILILVFIMLSIPVNVKNIYSKFDMPKNTIASEEIEALKFLKEKSNLDAIVLINPQQFSQDPIYIPALSERRVYLASPGFALQTGVDAREQIESVTEFFKTPQPEFLTKNKIAYIYFIKTNYLELHNLLLNKINAESVFENNQVIIWKVK